MARGSGPFAGLWLAARAIVVLAEDVVAVQKAVADVAVVARAVIRAPAAGHGPQSISNRGCEGIRLPAYTSVPKVPPVTVHVCIPTPFGP